MLKLSIDNWSNELKSAQPVPIVGDRLPEAIANFLKGKGAIEAHGDDLALVQQEVPQLQIGDQILVTQCSGEHLWLELGTT